MASTNLIAEKQAILRDIKRILEDRIFELQIYVQKSETLEKILIETKNALTEKNKKKPKAIRNLISKNTFYGVANRVKN